MSEGKKEQDSYETLADIEAEMRCGNFDAVNAVRCGCYNEIKTLMKNLADRIHAARQRELNANSKSAQVEFCNMAKMREALEKIDRLVWDKRRHTKEEVEAHRLATEALSAPARNCDRFKTASEALEAHKAAYEDDNFKNGQCELGCPECDDFGTKCEVRWLFAEAKGGANEQG